MEGVCVCGVIVVCPCAQSDPPTPAPGSLRISPWPQVWGGGWGRFGGGFLWGCRFYTGKPSPNISLAAGRRRRCADTTAATTAAVGRASEQASGGWQDSIGWQNPSGRGQSKPSGSPSERVLSGGFQSTEPPTNPPSNPPPNPQSNPPKPTNQPANQPIKTHQPYQNQPANPQTKLPTHKNPRANPPKLTNVIAQRFPEIFLPRVPQRSP